MSTLHEADALAALKGYGVPDADAERMMYQANVGHGTVRDWGPARSCLVTLEWEGRDDAGVLRYTVTSQSLDGQEWPKSIPTGRGYNDTIWACCVSRIGRPCAHERHMSEGN